MPPSQLPPQWTETESTQSWAVRVREWIGWPLSPDEKKEEAIIEPSTPEGCTFRIVYGGLGGKIARRRRRNIKQVRNGHCGVYERFFDKDKGAAWTKVISDELIVAALLRFTFNTSQAKTCVSWAAPLTKPCMCLLLKVSQADLLLWLEWCAWLCLRLMWQVRWASRRRYRIRQISWRDFSSRRCQFDYDILETWERDIKN